jgi:hypothetical protein
MMSYLGDTFLDSSSRRWFLDWYLLALKHVCDLISILLMCYTLSICCYNYWGGIMHIVGMMSLLYITCCLYDACVDVLIFLIWDGVLDSSSTRCFLLSTMDYDRQIYLYNFLICDKKWYFLVDDLFSIKCYW